MANKKNSPKKKVKKQKRAMVIKARAKIKKKVFSIKKNQTAKQPDEVFHKAKFRIVGIGGGAGSIISEIEGEVQKVDFVAANSDLRALKELPKNIKRFQFGQQITGGLGTGMNSQMGEAAALQDKEKIKNIFKGQDFCVIIASLGGGISSGATPLFAKTAREMGAITYGIFTMPFSFEGSRKMEMAQEALKKIKPYFNAYSVVPNERIFQVIDKNTPLKSALSAINEKLAEGLEGLIEMICLPGIINIDFADLRTVLDGRGRLAYLNVVKIENDDKGESAEKILSSPLYTYGPKGAKGILYNICGGKDLQLTKVSKISETISKSASKEARIIFGINQGKESEKNTRISIFAVGCGAKLFSDNKDEDKPKPVVIKKNNDSRAQKRQVNKKIEAKPKPKTKPIVKKMEKKPIKQNKKNYPPKSGGGGKSEIAVSAPEIKPAQPQVQLTSTPAGASGDIKIRRNALELRKAAEEEEKKLMEQEKVWDPPAIFRKKQINNS
jgi:cell division protein FtsZ